MLEINNYTNYILNDISFYLDKNLIILGSNGAGKTTLAKVLCGLIKSDKVDINGKIPSKIYGETRTKLINYIPPKLDIFDEFIDVQEFLQLNNLFGIISTDEVLTLLQINYLKNKSCKNLSSGESQLLLTAGAILHNAQFTILDEPTSNLDPKKIKTVYKILKDNNILKNKIIITHNLNLALKLEYNILFLENGKIKFLGSNKDFFDNENLNAFFDGSVKKIDNNIVVDL